jgi:thiol-disulfide isomerase/thioredoxin
VAKIVVTKRTRRGVLGVATLLFVAIIAGALALSGGDTVTDTAGGESDVPQATFALFDGGEATFADFEGKPLIVNFWASWCPACVAELPDFQAVHAEFGDEVTFLGMANADRREGALALADDVGLTYTLADDPEGELFREFGLISMPSTIFIDANGRIQDVFGGILNEPLLIERLEQLIEAS